jgi:SAM-dependent methyltransferase
LVRNTYIRGSTASYVVYCRCKTSSSLATAQTIKHFSKYAPELKGPILEIGSLIDSSYVQHKPKDIHGRNIPEQFIGIDIFAGEGVDYVLNLCKDDEVEKLPVKQFQTVHCHYIMEHVMDIFSMARNIEKVLAPGGVLLLSVPFAWRIHRIPVDMWRFTPQSLDYLFPNVEFIDEKSALSLRRGDATYRLNEFPELNLGKDLDKYPPYIKWYIKTLNKLKLHNNIFNQRALLHETNIMMYGIKRDQPTYTYLDKKYLDN